MRNRSTVSAVAALLYPVILIAIVALSACASHTSHAAPASHAAPQKHSAGASTDTMSGACLAPLTPDYADYLIMAPDGAQCRYDASHGICWHTSPDGAVTPIYPVPSYECADLGAPHAYTAPDGTDPYASDYAIPHAFWRQFSAQWGAINSSF